MQFYYKSLLCNVLQWKLQKELVFYPQMPPFQLLSHLIFNPTAVSSLFISILASVLRFYFTRKIFVFRYFFEPLWLEYFIWYEYTNFNYCWWLFSIAIHYIFNYWNTWKQLYKTQCVIHITHNAGLSFFWSLTFC